MRQQNIEQKITRTGVISLAALAIIGIIACFTGAFIPVFLVSKGTLICKLWSPALRIGT